MSRESDTVGHNTRHIVLTVPLPIVLAPVLSISVSLNDIAGLESTR